MRANCQTSKGKSKREKYYFEERRHAQVENEIRLNGMRWEWID